MNNKYDDGTRAATCSRYKRDSDFGICLMFADSRSGTAMSTRAPGSRQLSCKQPLHFALRQLFVLHRCCRRSSAATARIRSTNKPAKTPGLDFPRSACTAFLCSLKCRCMCGCCTSTHSSSGCWHHFGSDCLMDTP